jgi:hypothetical protein
MRVLAFAVCVRDSDGDGITDDLDEIAIMMEYLIVLRLKE